MQIEIQNILTYRYRMPIMSLLKHQRRHRLQF